MMGEKSTTLVVLLAVALLATAGCLDLVTGKTPEYESSEASVPSGTLSQTGYQVVDVDPNVEYRQIYFGNITRDVKIVESVNRYERQVAGDGFARFLAISSPSALIAEQEVNPVGRADADWLLDNYRDEYYSGLDMENHTVKQGTRTVEILGAERTIQQYTGDYVVDSDTTVTVDVHLTHFIDGDDYVVLIAVHTQGIGEQPRVDTLLQNVQH